MERRVGEAGQAIKKKLKNIWLPIILLLGGPGQDPRAETNRAQVLPLLMGRR
jgi:hypothetical protein